MHTDQLSIVRRWTAAISCACLIWGYLGKRSQGIDDQPFPPESVEFFEREVRPLFLEHCNACHSEKVGNIKGGLSLDSRDSVLAGGESGPAVVPGDLSASLLVEAIRRESFEMPPEKPLSDKDREILERWVELGAPWGHASSDQVEGDWLAQRAATHWAWRSVPKVDVPQIAQDQWSNNTIDRFILSTLDEQGLSPAPRAADAVLLRRLVFDLTGLPPKQEDTPHFDQPLTDARYERMVEQLLASPQFGVRWGRHWLDLVRYAETLGHEFDYPIRNAWRYRDMVVDALNTDLPYNRFVIDHISGDLHPEPRYHPLTGIDQSLTATGWWWLGESLHAPVDVKQDWAQRLDNQIDVFSKTFVGMTLACARCHDHKFDAMGMTDYYGLSAIIESTRRQYALTDPGGEISRQQEHMAEAIEQTTAPKRAAADLERESIAKWLETALHQLGQLAADEREAVQGAIPCLPPLAILADASGDEDFAERWQGWLTATLSADRAYQNWLNESRQFADLRHGLPEGWHVRAASRIPSDSDWDWFSSNLPLPVRGGIFASQQLGLKPSLRLDSPTFDVESTHICLKMRGKSAQSSIVVSNYFMQEFHNLLFGDLRKPIDQPLDSGWVVHSGDLNKYVGHPAFLSIEDEELAWFELEEVRFANRPPPSHTPNALTVQIAGREIASRDVLRQQVEDTLLHAWSQYRQSGENEQQTTPETEWVRGVVQLSGRLGIAPPGWDLALVNKSQDQLRQIDQQTPSPTIVLSACEGTGRDGAIALRGNPHQRGDATPRACMAEVVPFADSVNGSGRWELAQSTVDPQHPLTARVVVNRVWHHLFGRGLASTPDNLGVLGGRPSHPELLDYLAGEFIAHGWSIKWLIREIVSSRTYQLDSQPNKEQSSLDPSGIYLSYRPIRRLSAEALRDAMLATAGSLDSGLDGPSVPVYLTDKMTGRGRPGASGPLDGSGRRTSFIEVRRNFLNPFLMAFDFPMPSTTVGNRNVSNVPAQALGMLNDPLTAELAQRWAKRLQAIENRDTRLREMFATAFTREPTDEEVTECLALIDDGSLSWTDVAHILLNAKEFLYLR